MVKRFQTLEEYEAFKAGEPKKSITPLTEKSDWELIADFFKPQEERVTPPKKVQYDPKKTYTEDEWQDLVRSQSEIEQGATLGEELSDLFGRRRRETAQKYLTATPRVIKQLGLEKTGEEEGVKGFLKNLARGGVEVAGLPSMLVGMGLSIPDAVEEAVEDPSRVPKAAWEATKTLGSMVDPREYTTEKLYEDPIKIADLLGVGIGGVAIARKGFRRRPPAYDRTPLSEKFEQDVIREQVERAKTPLLEGRKDLPLLEEGSILAPESSLARPPQKTLIKRKVEQQQQRPIDLVEKFVEESADISGLPRTGLTRKRQVSDILERAPLQMRPRKEVGFQTIVDEYIEVPRPELPSYSGIKNGQEYWDRIVETVKKDPDTLAQAQSVAGFKKLKKTKKIEESNFEDLISDAFAPFKDLVKSERGSISSKKINDSNIKKLQRSQDAQRELLKRARRQAKDLGVSVDEVLNKIGLNEKQINALLIASQTKKPTVDPSVIKGVKDIPGGQTFIPEEVILKATGETLEGAFAHPFYRQTFRPVKEMLKSEGRYITDKANKFEGIAKKYDINVRDNAQAAAIFDALDKIPNKSLSKKVSELAKEFPKYDTKTIGAARDIRKVLNDLRDEANVARRKAGQKEIPFIEAYAPYMRKTAVFKDLLRRGKAKETMPDFIVSQEAFNPRAQARSGSLMEKETNIWKLADNYIESIAQDIYRTPVIKQINATSNLLEKAGYTQLPQYLKEYVNVSLAKRPGWIDKRAFKNTPRFEAVVNAVNGARALQGLAGNIKWILFTQPSSLALTLGKAGFVNTAKGIMSYATNPKLRNKINSMPGLEIKRRGAGFMKQTGDAEVGKRIFQTKRDIANNAMGSLSSYLERLLHGSSIAAGYNKGKQLGLKGKALDNFAEYVGSRTQSEYARELRSLLANNKTFRFISPFQSFTFEMLNHLRRASGAKSVAPYAKKADRIKMITQGLAGMYLFDQLSQMTQNRELYTIGSFVPVFGRGIDVLTQAVQDKIMYEFTGDEKYNQRFSSGYYPISVIQDAVNISRGVDNFIKYGNPKKLRQLLIAYGTGLSGIGGGAQLNRIVDTVEAQIDGYVKTSGAGRVAFPAAEGPAEIVESLLAGPYSSEAGQRYIQTGFKSLGKKQSKKFKRLQKQDPQKAREYFEGIMEKRERKRSK